MSCYLLQMLLCEEKADTSKCLTDVKKCMCDGKFQKGGGTSELEKAFPMSHELCHRRDIPVTLPVLSRERKIAGLFSVGQMFKSDENLMLPKGIFDKLNIGQ